MIERLLTSTCAAVAPALLLAGLLHLLAPAAWPALAQRPQWPVWALLVAWLLVSLLLAALPPVRRWRAALVLTAVLAVMLGGFGAALASPLGPGMLVALALVAASCFALAAGLGRSCTKAGSAKAGSGKTMGPGRSRKAPLRQRLLAAAPFWLAAIVLLESFRWAHVVAREPLRGAGMAGMLIAFFLMLPAASLQAWYPRTCALLWVVAGMALAAAGWRAGLLTPGAGAAACLAMAWLVLQGRHASDQAGRHMAEMAP